MLDQRHDGRELADTTRSIDLGRKAVLYARYRVPEYWAADREGQMLVRHAGPDPEGYADVVAIPFGQPLASATIPGLTVDTACLRG